MIQPEVNYDEKNVFYIDDIISGLFGTTSSKKSILG